MNLPPTQRLEQERLRGHSGLAGELDWRFITLFAWGGGWTPLCPHEQARQLDAHVALCIDDRYAGILQETARFLGRSSCHDQEMRVIRKLTGVFDVLASSSGVRLALRLYFYDVGDVPSAHHNVRPFATARGRPGRDPGYLMEDAEGVPFQRTLYIQDFWHIHNDCEYSTFSDYSCWPACFSWTYHRYPDVQAVFIGRAAEDTGEHAT
ncbi:hypothetical protein A9X02_06205 [Mycobacterium malmoense]|nr:hypothetical protein A9X02_06205 [Mycobacterium malmoense]